MNAIPFYEIRNDPSSDRIYARLFTEPGILALQEFPVTESRFRILRESFSYDEIVDELRYCMGSQRSAENLASLIIDDLLLEEAFLLYPELIRVAIDASIATVVKDPALKERLLLMFPGARVFHLPDDDYAPIHRASEALKRTWIPPGKDFPWHLRPLSDRVKAQNAERFPDGFPSAVAARLIAPFTIAGHPRIEL